MMNTNPYPGVSYCKGHSTRFKPWRAQIKRQGFAYWTQQYATPKAAFVAREEKLKDLALDPGHKPLTAADAVGREKANELDSLIEFEDRVAEAA